MLVRPSVTSSLSLHRAISFRCSICADRLKRDERPIDVVWKEYFDGGCVSGAFMMDRDQPLSKEIK